MERKKIVRITMKITEAIIGIIKEEFGDKDENRQKKNKKICEDSRSAVGRIHTGKNN